MQSLRLTSLNVIMSLNIILHVLSSQYGRQYQKSDFRNERYARIRIYHGCEGQIEKSVPLNRSLTSLVTEFSIYPSHTIDSYNPT